VIKVARTSVGFSTQGEHVPDATRGRVPAGHHEADRLDLECAARPRTEESPAPRDEPQLVEVSKTRRTADSSALRILALALLPYIEELLSVQRQNDGLVDVCGAVPGPRRTIMAACRRGDIVGAVRVGRRWLAPRAGIDTWLRARGPRNVPSPHGDEDDLESVRRSLATPGRRRRRV
jgi:hypothetical protein